MPKVFDVTICERHDIEMSMIPKYSGEGFLCVCSECSKEKEAKLAKEQAQAADNQRSEKLKRMFAECQIGKRFQRCNFESYKSANEQSEKIKIKCQQYAENFTENFKLGYGLILSGKPGTGKNHLAAAICNAVMESGKSTLHTTVMKMIRRIKTTWRKDSEEQEQRAILSFCKPDLLVIDEVGVQFDSQTEKLLLTEIINERYERMLPTILISNLTIDQLKEALGDRIIDRFRDGGKVLVFDWDSYRKSTHNN